MRRLGLLLAAAIAGGGCTDDLTVPGNCPDFCPSGQPEIRELVLPALQDSDTSFFGYVGYDGASSLLVSDRLEAGEARAWYQLFGRIDSITVLDTVRAYTVDSVGVVLNMVARDSTLSGLRLYLYGVPRGIDTLSNYEAVDTLLTEARFIDSITVSDTLRRGNLRALLTGDALARFEALVGDSGRLGIGVRMRANLPSGVRLGSTTASSGGMTVTTYARVNVADTARQRQTLTQTTEQNGFVIDRAVTADPDLLRVGGLPAWRALLRFEVPPVLRDSAILVRATLELTPHETLFGLPNDEVFLVARGVTQDVGAKSTPVLTLSGVAVLKNGSSDVLSLDVQNIVQFWRGADPLPPTFNLSLLPEGGAFHRPVLRSTRSGAGAPMLRITYVLSPGLDRP